MTYDDIKHSDDAAKARRDLDFKMCQWNLGWVIEEFIRQQRWPRDAIVPCTRAGSPDHAGQSQADPWQRELLHCERLPDDGAAFDVFLFVGSNAPVTLDLSVHHTPEPCMFTVRFWGQSYGFIQAVEPTLEKACDAIAQGAKERVAQLKAVHK